MDANRCVINLSTTTKDSGGKPCMQAFAAVRTNVAYLSNSSDEIESIDPSNTLINSMALRKFTKQYPALSTPCIYRSSQIQ